VNEPAGASLAGLDARLILAAFLGAVLALAGLAAIRMALARVRRRAGGAPSGAGASLQRDAERFEGGLRELAREVEERLDRKLDRLEALVAEARSIEAAADSTQGTGGRGAREDSLGGVSQDERERVLALAAMGKRADAIAEEAGLPRGEVDLILRLHRSAERVHD
jgi:hypothetical protein